MFIVAGAVNRTENEIIIVFRKNFFGIMQVVHCLTDFRAVIDVHFAVVRGSEFLESRACFIYCRPIIPFAVVEFVKFNVIGKREMFHTEIKGGLRHFFGFRYAVR